MTLVCLEEDTSLKWGLGAACLGFISVLVDLTLSSPAHTSPLETSHPVLLETCFILGSLLMTVYLMLPISQGEQPPKAINGCVGSEGTADACIPISVVLHL